MSAVRYKEYRKKQPGERFVWGVLRMDGKKQSFRTLGEGEGVRRKAKRLADQLNRMEQVLKDGEDRFLSWHRSGEPLPLDRAVRDHARAAKQTVAVSTAIRYRQFADRLVERLGGVDLRRLKKEDIGRFVRAEHAYLGLECRAAASSFQVRITLDKIMDIPVQIVVRADLHARIALTGISVVALLLVRLPQLRRFTAWAYGFAAVAGIAAFFNFGLLFHQWDSGFVDRWEQFHYQLGSKYFPELGHDGLYVASILAHKQTDPDFPIERIRDLRTNRLADPESTAVHIREVRNRFSKERWTSFVSDHQNYIDHASPRMWGRIRQDHGYNPTPAWTFVARIFGARLPSTNVALCFLGSIDVVLMVLMFTVVFRTYGYQAGCLGLAIAGLGYGWHFMYIGAFLRLDWLAAVVVGVCMLKRERFGLAGACIGYATIVRIFPILFLMGPALLVLKGLLRGERPRWAPRLMAGFALVVCLGLAGGCMTGRGVGAWSEFAKSIRLFRETWSTTSIGVDTLLLSDPSFLLANRGAPPEKRTQADVQRLFDERRAGRIAATALMLGMLALAVWNAGLAESAVLGMIAIFTLTAAPVYYWIMLVAVPLRSGQGAALALLVASAGAHWIQRLRPPSEYGPWTYGVLAWTYALILVGWILPAVLRQLGAHWRR